MKRAIPLLAALLLMVTFSACSAPEIPAITHDAETPAASATPSHTAAAEPTAEPVKPFRRGTWNGMTFTSDYAGLTLTLPNEGWTIVPDEELAELMNTGMDAWNATQPEKNAIQLTNFTDMMARNPDTGDSIILMYENLTLNPAGKALTVEEYAQTLAETLLAAAPYPLTVDAATRVTLCGSEYLALPVHIAESDLHQTYLIRFEGDMRVDLILTGTGDGSIDALLALFAD